VVRRLFLLAIAVLLPVGASALPLVRIAVRTSNGHPVSDATITIVADSQYLDVKAGSEGRFEAALPSGVSTVDIDVSAAGFIPSRTTHRIEGDTMDIDIALDRQPFNETIVVTPSRLPTRVADTAASVAVVSRQTLDTTAALTLDDKLRQVPGFSLLRRSGSRVANPTSQGVSLRGIAPTGSSRALVLDDGIPLNDPFGGWVYWARIPQPAIAAIEVLRGSASDLYGSAAMGGVIQVVRRGMSERATSLRVSIADDETWDGSVLLARQLGPTFTSLSAQGFSTDGYILVDPAERGLVDTSAGSRNSSVELTSNVLTSDKQQLFVRGSHFRERRDNGTPLQTNETRSNQLSLGAGGLAGGAELFFRGYLSDQDYEQVFSAIRLDRDTERLTVRQSVPSSAAGFTVSGNRTVGSRSSIVVGVDHRRVSGTSEEENYSGPRVVLQSAGGKQRANALFAQHILSILTNLSLISSVRYDNVRNHDGAAIRTGLTTDRLDFDARSESAWSPRLSVLYRTSERLAWTASGYGSFRSPTLNELYRAFRVGNIVTNANDELKSERLRGGEAGAVVSIDRGSVRLTIFSMEIDRTIANVTQSMTPSLITRQRQNLGASRSRGLEVDADYRFDDRWQLSGGAALLDSTVQRFSANRALEGMQVPQVPRFQGSLQLRFSGVKISAATQLRWSGSQFEDDLNLMPLASFMTVDGFLARQFTRSTAIFLAAENLTDESYEIGRTPVTTIGAPRSFRAGVRFDLP